MSAVSEDIKIEKGLLDLWCANIVKIVAEVLLFVPPSWIPLEKMPLRVAAPIIFNHMKVNGGRSVNGLIGLFPDFPKHYKKTKKALYSWLQNERPDQWEVFIKHCEDALEWMRFTSKNGRSGEGMLIFVHPKDDNYKEEKLESGRHRSIQSPPTAVSLLEFYYSGWYDVTEDGIRLHTVDDLYAIAGENITNSWVLGGSFTRLCRWFDENPGHAVSYDVVGWDRHLNFPVIRSMLRSLVRNEVVADNICYGACGKGTYLVGRGMYTLEGVCVWCSGVLKTLLGNCTIHQGILHTAHLSGFVQGDDGIAACDEKEIVRVFSSLGFTLKDVSHSDSHLDFCKMLFNPKDKTAGPDVVRMLKRAAAGPPKDHRKSVEGILQMVLDAEIDLRGCQWRMTAGSVQFPDEIERWIAAMFVNDPSPKWRDFLEARTRICPPDLA